MRRRKIMRNFLVLLFFIVAGCGYTTRGFVYPEDTIIIKPVVNKIDITSESGKYSDYTSFPILIENRLTNKIINKFNIDGNLKVVSEDPQALVLTCNVTSYDKETLRYTDNDDSSEQRLRLGVDMKLVSGDGKVLKEKRVVGESTYYPEGVDSANDSARVIRVSESAAQMDLIDDTARRICEAVTEEW